MINEIFLLSPKIICESYGLSGKAPKSNSMSRLLFFTKYVTAFFKDNGSPEHTLIIPSTSF